MSWPGAGDVECRRSRERSWESWNVDVDVEEEEVEVVEADEDGRR